MKFTHNQQKRLISLMIISLLLSACTISDLIPTSSAKELPKFTSCDDISKLMRTNRGNYYLEGDFDSAVSTGVGILSPSNLPASAGAMKNSEAFVPQSSSDYSRTNVQVEGVDEADIVKTDGKYIYTLSKNKLYIVQALPPNQMAVISVINLESSNREYANAQEFYINGVNLVIFGNRNFVFEPSPLEKEKTLAPSYYPYYRSGTFIEVYNLSNPQSPILKRTIETEGNYITSRMIGSHVYTVLNSYPQYYPPYPEPYLKDSASGNGNVNSVTEEQLLPKYRDTGISSSSSFAPIARCADIHYVPEPDTYQYLTIVAFPVDKYDQAADKNITFGAGQNVYASLNNLYVARTNYNYSYSRPWINRVSPVPFMPEPSPQNTSKTIIYKFSLKDGKTSYVGEGNVPGTVLNQFSMDEYEGNFRIATTEGEVWDEMNKSTSNIYILNAELKPMGSITGIAPGEKIYSARFMGKRGYLVTFKKVDPFFVFDLSDPNHPKTLGKLKIPGYSDYLHPYDDNHIIGLGKETIEAEGGNFAWYQGIKMAVFDVTDVNNPKEMFKTVIGDRGTDSPALSNHKAFLFDRQKNLLVIPVSVAEIQDPIIREKIKNSEKIESPVYGDFVFQGAYVYNLTLTNGFDLKGKISHMTDPDVYKKAGYYMGDYDSQIQRALFIDNHLYTVSNNKIMANNFMGNLEQEGSVSLTEPYTYTNPLPNVNANGWVIE